MWSPGRLCLSDLCIMPLFPLLLLSPPRHYWPKLVLSLGFDALSSGSSDILNIYKLRLGWFSKLCLPEVSLLPEGAMDSGRARFEPQCRQVFSYDLFVSICVARTGTMWVGNTEYFCFIVLYICILLLVLCLFCSMWAQPYYYMLFGESL
jgi:hypothetical protein